MSVRVLVCGGRDYTDRDTLFVTLDKLHARRPIGHVIHGGAAGADTLADEWATERGVACTKHLANWKAEGRAAGSNRNARMLAKERPDIVVAFPGGPGTRDMIVRARVARVEVVVVPLAKTPKPNATATRRNGVALPMSTRPALTLPGAADASPSFDPRQLGARCGECPLEARGRPVPSTPAAHGNKPKLVIIGEAPGHLEHRIGLPFIGPSGKLLNAYLREARFRRDDATVMNAVACRIESDDADVYAKATACCAPRLATELAAIPSDVPLVTLGKSATRSVLGTNGIMKARGFVWTAPAVAEHKLRAMARLVEKKYARQPVKRAAANDALVLATARAAYAGRTVLPSVHPAHVLRNELWGPILGIDLDRAVRFVRAREAGSELPLRDEARFEIARTAEQLRRKLKRAKLGEYIEVDIESTSADPLTCELTCVGVGSIADPGRAVIAWPWHPSMARVLAEYTEERVGVGHNIISFDEPALRRFGIAFRDVEDTLIAQHSFASHMPKSLAQVVSQFVDARPWKIIHRGAADEKGLSAFDIKNENLPVYNSSDISLGAHVWVNLQNDLEPERAVYEHDKDLARVAREMQRAGMLLDAERRDFLSTKLGKRSDALLGQMRTLTGNRHFNPQRPADIRKALYGRFKAPVLELTAKTHMRSTAIGTLQALREREGTRASALADLLIRRRAAMKSKSTFLDGIETDDFHRAHFAWRSFGAVTGRMSARGVVQLLPKYAEARCNSCYNELPKFPESGKCPRCKARMDWAYEDMIRSVFIARPGFQFVYFDLAQSEARAAANISDDPRFIAVCESKDVHAANACILFPEFADAIRSDPKGIGKQFRDVAKNALFGILYRAETPKIFATLNDKGFPIEMSSVERMMMYVHREYRQYYRYCDEQLEFCRREGYLRTELLGRIRWFGRFPKPTETANFKVQSFIADLMNQRLIAMWQSGLFGLRAVEMGTKWAGDALGLNEPSIGRAWTQHTGGVELVAQVHDSCVFECPDALVPDLRTEIKRVWAEPVIVPRTGRSFVMPVDDKTGTRWSALG